jgi:acyl-CoA hydrolase
MSKNAALVELTDEQIKKAKSMLRHLPGQANKVLARSINRAMENARANTVKAVRSQYTVAAGEVRKTLRVRRANAKNLTAMVTSAGKPLPLISFKTNPKTVNGRRRTPIRVAQRHGSPSTFDRAFIARARSGGELNVYERVGKKRLPMRIMWGPSVPQMVENDWVIEDIAQSARDTMNVRLDHEINRVLNEGGAR